MVQNITDFIFYVGANDHDLDLFEGQYIVPNGMAYNSYVIVDDKIAVFDTIDKSKTEEWLDNLAEVLGDRKPDYLIVQHMEPDHSASQQTAGRNNTARPAGRSGGQQSATGQRTSHAAQPQRQVQGQRPAPQRSSAQRPAPQRSASQRPSSQRPASQQPPRRRQQEENQQLTLEDIFGGDNK